MVEGGANVINELLNTRYDDSNDFIVDSLIVTIGPTFLGQKGVEVSPASGVKLKDITWWTGCQDSVLCARLNEFHVTV
ncbi:unnamed protein product [Ambrosiozyma monospora]|uniref:Unnamed protein product n=1 Tax=Ambrosiozyma monospora TaxID=43982 RepID=A0ACB5SX17_AMBMO|nr:unnamed protein product [Ambrosiozyma monospora]